MTSLRSWSWRRVLLAAALVALGIYAVVAMVTLLRFSLRGDQEPIPGSRDVRLDGRRPIDERALAGLALSRARLGARWLTLVVRPDGSFFYKYRPESDSFEARDYNEIRHAGTTYSLFQSVEVDGDAALRATAERAARYIDRASIPAPDGSGRAYVREGTTKLGGQALALVALLERRRVVDDTRYDRLIREQARFLRSLERRDEPGRYFQSYRPAGNRRLPVPASDYYPGEALLALIRLAQHFPRAGYREDAIRAGDFLARQEMRRPELLENHWLAMAFGELHRLAPKAQYREVVYRQADSMRSHQHTARDEHPERIGAPTNRRPINYTSSATKAEALVAAWALARHLDDPAATRRFSLAARRNVQFQLRVQHTPATSRGYSRPRRLAWAWGQDAFNPYVRIDFVQHNVSALLGVWHMTRRGDIPLAAGSARAAAPAPR